LCPQQVLALDEHGHEAAATGWGHPSGSVLFVDLIKRIEGDLAALRLTGMLDEALRRWQTGRHALRSFADAAALIDFLRDPDALPRHAKDSALAAVCMEATHGDQAASTLLLWLILPGLLRVRQRLAVWSAMGRDDLDAELIAGVWEAASAVGPASTGVAARMLNRARRRGHTAVRRETDWAGRCEPLSIEVPDESLGSGDVGLEEILRDAVEAAVISMEDAELICTTRATIGEVRERLGVTLNAAQMRRHRARRRFLDWLADQP
jgi:hypothetical protein